MSTKDLIDSLSKEAGAVKPLAPPSVYFIRAGALLLSYALVIVLLTGVRSDMPTQLDRPLLLAELALMGIILLTSVFTAICMRYPDQYQNYRASQWSVYALVTFIILIGVQFFLPQDPMMNIPSPLHGNTFQCTLEIAAIAIIPAFILIRMIAKGASVNIGRAGFYSMLASTMVGCIVLRLYEQNDAIIHITLWHYIPVLIFSAIGAFLGSKFLKW